MKTQREIEANLIQQFAAQTSKVTDFTVGSVIRSVFVSVAAVLAEMWHELVQTKRKLFIDTSIGSDLDTLAARRGLTRRGATKSSVVLVFQGTETTAIPQGTQVGSATGGVVFATVYAVTIGAKNSGFSGALSSIGLGTAVLAESAITGSKANVSAKSVTTMVSSVPGVTSVVNPAPAQGGADAEPDDLFANRIRDQVSLLNQGTQAFFEAQAREAALDASAGYVLRALAKADTSNNGVKLTLVKDSGAGFSGGQLTTIASSVYATQRALNPVTCENVTFTEIGISLTTYTPVGTDLAALYRSVADALSDFVDWRQWPWGQDVNDDDLLAVVKAVASIGDIDLTTWRVNGAIGDVPLASDSLPRLVSLSITDSRTSTTQNHSLTSSYGSQQ